MYADATAMCEKALRLPFEGVEWSRCGRVDVLVGRRQEALSIMKRLLAQERASPYQVALLYDALGDRKQAFRWLALAFEEQAPEMCFLRIERFSSELRSDSRFQNLLRHMDFPPNGLN
jgi:tetratricopeptide (TPR) repeat protein